MPMLNVRVDWDMLVRLAYSSVVARRLPRASRCAALQGRKARAQLVGGLLRAYRNWQLIQSTLLAELAYLHLLLFSFAYSASAG